MMIRVFALIFILACANARSADQVIHDIYLTPPDDETSPTPTPKPMPPKPTPSPTPLIVQQVVTVQQNIYPATPIYRIFNTDGPLCNLYTLPRLSLPVPALLPQQPANTSTNQVAKKTSNEPDVYWMNSKPYIRHSPEVH